MKKKILKYLLLIFVIPGGQPYIALELLYKAGRFFEKTLKERRKRMNVTCPINGGILVSLDLSDEVAKLATNKSELTGKHIQTLLREASKPIVESGRKPTEEDFREYLDGLSTN
ncbi:MAG: hypothetical protein WC238_01715 [Parcubacteria group bacterium]